VLSRLKKKGAEIIVFTASEQNYADPVLDLIDPAHKIFDYRLYWDKCIRTPDRKGIKDLRIFQNRSLKNIVLVDNLVRNYFF